MKTTDLYTKIVLTVIALCLVIIVLRQSDIIPKVKATPVPAYDIKPNYDGSINVRITNWPSTYPIKLDTYSRIPVEVKNTPSVKIDNNYIYTKPY